MKYYIPNRNSKKALKKERMKLLPLMNNKYVFIDGVPMLKIKIDISKCKMTEMRNE